MPELENELRTRLRQDAERVRPDVDAAWSQVSRRLAAPSPARSSAPGWQRPWVITPVAAALVAVLAAVVLVPDDAPTTVAVGPESAEQADEAQDEATELRTGGPEAGAPAPTTAPAERTAGAPAHRGRYDGAFEGMFPATTWEEYDRLRHEMAAGGRAWAADAEQVAIRFVRERIGAEPDGRLRSLGELAAEYQWSGGRVVLWRYGPAGDPWVVTASDASRVELAPPGE